MAPSCQKGVVFHPALPPLQALHCALFDQGSQIDRVYVAEASVLAVAACYYEKLVAYPCRRMEPSRAWAGSARRGRDL